MKTKIEAITNKRMKKKNVKMCMKQKKRKTLNKEIKCILTQRRLNGAVSCQKQFR